MRQGMTKDATAMIESIVTYCNAKWVEANEASSQAWPTPEMQTGRKMAYNDVLQYARALLTPTGK